MTRRELVQLFGYSLFTGALFFASVAAAGTNPEKPRVGVYDSRVVAYAYFWSDAHQRQLQGLMEEAKAAKASGDTQQFKAREEALKKAQDQAHLQIFSTAPATEAMEALKPRLPAIQQAAKVSRLVSKWDKAALGELRGAEKVDVTDLLLREFTLTEKQRKVVEDLKRQKPLSIEKCQKMIEKHEI